MLVVAIGSGEKFYVIFLENLQKSNHNQQEAQDQIEKSITIREMK